ncbi:MAG TPA: hypothetical protein VIF57_24155 [Polyangia bacterium]|jgi:hypothetical protein
MRARVAVTVLGFFAVLAATGTPPSLAGASAAAVGRAQTLGGEIDRTPGVASHGTSAQLAAARAARAQPGPWKLPPLALVSAVSATPVASAFTRPFEVACAPIAPPSAPRSCRGPPCA